jgi:prepilin-type N-terminal cleavage/methylation domain-containing protein
MNNQPHLRKILKDKDAGFTLIELLVVIIMVGILSAIAVPSWLTFVQQQRLNAAQNKALIFIREAQANAKRDKVAWQVCFRDDGNQVFADVQRINPQNDACVTTPTPREVALIDENSKAIKILETSTTLNQSSINPKLYRVSFNSDTSVIRRKDDAFPQRITFATRSAGSQKSCVSVETILGAITNKCD